MIVSSLTRRGIIAGTSVLALILLLLRLVALSMYDKKYW